MPISHFSTNLEESFSSFRKQNHHHKMNHYANGFSDLDNHQKYLNSHQQQQQHYNFYSNQPTATAVTHQNHINNSSKEAMFEKPLTPSDVGKLNRLVIPKQHAEKYFPLNGSNYNSNNGNNDDDSPPSSGMLLGFEDESGKSWKFRYSYWNSSQSYVLTKGWSRYVKEKRLDAGDVVVFERDFACADRLFIGWRRRAGSGGGGGCRTASAAVVGQDGSRMSYSNGHVMRGGYVGQDSRSSSYVDGVRFGIAPPPPYRPDHCFNTGGITAMQSHKETRRGVGISSNNNSSNPGRRLLRLFGVNMECDGQTENEYSSQTTSSSESSSTLSLLSQSQQGALPPSSSSSAYGGGNYFDYAAAASSNNNNLYNQNQYHDNQMDTINFPQMENWLGR